MTDFLQWWADHWPLVPVLVLYIPFAWHAFWAYERLLSRLKRRREP